jgi:hypothetical protein
MQLCRGRSPGTSCAMVGVMDDPSGWNLMGIVPIAAGGAPNHHFLDVNRINFSRPGLCVFNSMQKAKILFMNS